MAWVCDKYASKVETNYTNSEPILSQNLPYISMIPICKLYII
jgi:hypothetical protein